MVTPFEKKLRDEHAALNAKDCWNYEELDRRAMLHRVIKEIDSGVDPVEAYIADPRTPYPRMQMGADAGMFYAPYVPLTVSTNPLSTTFPNITFKTRYGIIKANRVDDQTDGSGI